MEDCGNAVAPAIAAIDDASARAEEGRIVREIAVE